MSSLDFWFELASTYSYLAAARIETVAKEHGVAVTWKPFLLGPIFGARALSTSPFNVEPDKGRYMWRDMERFAEALELPFRRPSVFPRNSTLAARIALVGAAEGWVAAFSRAVFAANFADDQDISDPGVLDAILTSLGLDGPSVRTLATSAAWKPKLREQTERAVELGIFGAPSFIVQGELFWGNDRLEQALSWACRNQ